MTAVAAETRACDLPDGTPHPAPFLADRGWQAIGGVYRREPAISPADRGILLAAAAVAAAQPGASQAVCESLGFLSRFPSALAVLDGSCRHPRLSLALSVLLRCQTGRDVAQAIRTAAFPEEAS